VQDKKGAFGFKTALFFVAIFKAPWETAPENLHLIPC
jgi:hypothetical protein